MVHSSVKPAELLRQTLQISAESVCDGDGVELRKPPQKRTKQDNECMASAANHMSLCDICNESVPSLSLFYLVQSKSVPMLRWPKTLPRVHYAPGLVSYITFVAFPSEIIRSNPFSVLTFHK